MFTGIPPIFNPELQQIVLIINTLFCIIALVVIEVLYIDAPATKRRHLRIYYPFIAAFICLLFFAFYKEISR